MSPWEKLQRAVRRDFGLDAEEIYIVSAEDWLWWEHEFLCTAHVPDGIPSAEVC